MAKPDLNTYRDRMDKAIVALNENYAKNLKKAGKITPVFRSDGSGDSFAFQNFLLKGAPKYWKTPPSTNSLAATATGVE